MESREKKVRKKKKFVVNKKPRELFAWSTSSNPNFNCDTLHFLHLSCRRDSNKNLRDIILQKETRSLN